MFNFFVERVGEVLLDYLVMYPGAFIRWILFGKADFEDYLDDEIEHNLFAVAGLLAPLAILFLMSK